MVRALEALDADIRDLQSGRRFVRGGGALGDPSWLRDLSSGLGLSAAVYGDLAEEHQQAIDDAVEPPVEPPKPPSGALPPHVQVGPATIFVEPGKVTLEDGKVLDASNDVRVETGHEIAAALRASKSGDVIEVADGVYRGGEWGFGPASAGRTAVKPNGAPIRSVAIVAAAGTRPTITDIKIGGRIDVAGGGGIDEVLLRGFTHWNSANSPTPIIVYKGARVGMLRIYDAETAYERQASWGGYGSKWALIRAEGRARYDIRRILSRGAQEHIVYVDCPGWDGAGCSVFAEITCEKPTGRTAVQITNRKDYNPGPSGSGDLYFADLALWTEAGGGGFGLTVAGHLGNVYGYGRFDYRGTLGAMVFWSDAGKGLHQFDDGYTIGDVVLDWTMTIDAPHSTYEPIQLDGCRSVTFNGPLEVVTSKPMAINDSHPHYGGPIDCGPVRFAHPINAKRPDGSPHPAPYWRGGKVATPRVIEEVAP